jgi:hypothetical protein
LMTIELVSNRVGETRERDNLDENGVEFAV